MASRLSDDAVWMDAECHTIQTQLYHLLGTSGLMEAVPVEWKEALEQRVRAVLGQNLLVRREQTRLLMEFDSREIPAIPFKGVDFAERYFGHLSARPTSDVDLLIHIGDLNRSIQCLRGLGFSGPYELNPIHFHCLMSKRVPHQSIPLNVELHWNLVTERRAKLIMNPLWMDSQLKKSYRYIRELSTQHTFYALCLHGANHQMESMKYFLDLVHLIYRFGEEIDYSTLLQQAESDYTSQRVRAVLSILYQRFTSLPWVKPLPFQPMDNPVGVLHSPLRSLDTWTFRWRELIDRLWPNPGVARWHTQADADENIARVYYRFYRARLMKRRSDYVHLSSIDDFPDPTSTSATFGK